MGTVLTKPAGTGIDCLHGGRFLWSVYISLIIER